MVQDTPNYAAAAAVSPSCGPAGVDAEMSSRNNTAACDLESEPGFAHNCARMSAFGREYRRPNNIRPERPLSAVLAVNQTSENSVREIFQDFQTLVYLHMVLDARNVFPSTASILPVAGIKVSSLSFSAKNRVELGHFTAVLSTQANSINYHKAEFEEFLSFRALNLS